jgi:hypothetical protein
MRGFPDAERRIISLTEILVGVRLEGKRGERRQEESQAGVEKKRRKVG